jgi:hypothetical protein
MWLRAHYGDRDSSDTTKSHKSGMIGVKSVNHMRFNSSLFDV